MNYNLLQIWNELREDLLLHLMKEEQVLFPYIKSLEVQNLRQIPSFGTILNPLNVLEAEHQNAGELMRRIAVLTNEFQTPEGACTTYRVLFSMLKEFEDKLHEHIHLENNILFVKGANLEKELS